MFTQEELKNILIILTRDTTTLRANEATAVAILQQKIGGLIQAPEEAPAQVETPVKEEKAK